jgi:glycosyltransferase involved in cell wall biosynthesis
MPGAERSVLHVLPHPGGGGEAYVELLSDMPGYCFDRVFLAPSATPSPSALGRALVEAIRGAGRYDLLHVHGEVASGLCLLLLATRPSVVTLHGLHLVRRAAAARRTAATLNLRAVLRAADRTICVSSSERDELVRAVGARAARRAIVIRNGVRLPAPAREDTRAETRRALGVTESEVVGIWVGSLDERKDPMSAVRAAERSDVTLLLVGDGPLGAEVQRAAGERTHVLGHRNDVPRLLAAADFYVLTSRREGLSLSLLEAMAHGLPPIVTELPENVEAIGEGGFAYGDQDALVAALDRLVRSESERTAVGERARQRVAEHFDVETMIARTRAVYDDPYRDRRGE